MLFLSAVITVVLAQVEHGGSAAQGPFEDNTGEICRILCSASRMKVIIHLKPSNFNKNF